MSRGNESMAVPAEPVAISNHPRRIERPAKRTVPDSIARDETVHAPVRIPIPTGSIPIRSSADEDGPGGLHAGLSFILRAQIAPGIQRALSGWRLWIETRRFPRPAQREFPSLLQLHRPV